MNWEKGSYNVKGSALKNLELYLNKVKPDGRGFDFWVTLKNNEKIDQITVSGWYDISPYYKTIEDVSRKIGIELSELIEIIAGFALEKDLNSIYKMFMKLEGPVKVLEASIMNVKNYFDFVTISIHKNELGTLTFSSSMPEDFIDYHIAADKGAISGILKVCGYKIDEYSVLLVRKNGETSFYSAEVRYSRK